MTDRLKYLTNAELREEIAHVVGADPTRYGHGSRRCLNRADIERVAQQLQPGDDDHDLRHCDLKTLYKLACEWAGGKHKSNAGNDWGVNRKNLKRIHRAVGAKPLRDEPQPQGVEV